MSDEKRGLTDPPTATEILADSEGDLEGGVGVERDPAKINLHSLVHGILPVTATVRIHDGSRLTVLADQIDSCPSDDDVPDALVEEWLATKARFDEGEQVTVQAWGEERIALFYAEMNERLGGHPGPDTPTAEVLRRSFRMDAAQIAAQIVTPEGKTADWVAALRESAPGEFAKLKKAVTRVNTQSAKVLVPDFSDRVSRLSRRGSK